jgi:Zn-dependent protease with chaperone function
MDNAIYPAAPAGVTPEKLAVSPAFRKQVSAVIGSIVLFALVYLILVIAAVGLAIACCWLGIALIIALPKFLTLMVGLGLMGVGISVIVFLFKFIFAVAKDENSRRVAVTEEEQPRLFAFIRRLTEETQTPFPQKIYISPDVNACVFYNSSFWSMFLPVRKNLEIGLGLVNSINISEFKAVMAHEFGHFSQKSMKLGSFTYNVNRVIHNMLYENNSYTSFLSAWGNIHGYLSIFAAITVRIARGIQWILRGMYKFINRNYMGLSREMEFHADTVAAGVSGGNNLVTALSRIEVAGSCYATALNNAGDKLKENKITRNIFTNQLTVLRSLAGEYRLPVQNGLPEISYSFVQSFSRSRINYRDQWASHPTLAERKAHLDKLDIGAVPDNNSPWILFDNPEALQEQLTKDLYREVAVKDEVHEYDGQEFEAWYARERAAYALPEVYKGFYDDRYIQLKDWNREEEQNDPTKTFDELFNDETGQLQSSISRLEKDMETVKAIKDGRLDVTSFDFDGTKYSRKDADEVIRMLEKDINTFTTRQQTLDKEAYRFFLQKAADKEGIKNAYQSLRTLSLQYDSYVEGVNTLLKTINPFYEGNITLEQVNSIISTLKDQLEPALKKAYQQLMDEDLLTKENNGELYASLKTFAEKDYFYFVSGEFQNNELNELTGLAIKTAEHFHKQKFAAYKKLLETQLTV